MAWHCLASGLAPSENTAHPVSLHPCQGSAIGHNTYLWDGIKSKPCQQLLPQSPLP